MSNFVMEHVNVLLQIVKAMKSWKNVVKLHLYSQVSSVAVSTLLYLRDLSDHVRGTVLEARNSSLEYFVAN